MSYYDPDQKPEASVEYLVGFIVGSVFVFLLMNSLQVATPC